MECSHCGRDAILFQPYSGQYLCPRHFTQDLERRAKRTLRHNRGIAQGDRILVTVDSDARSQALLYFLNAALGMRRDLSWLTLSLDEVQSRLREDCEGGQGGFGPDGIPSPDPSSDEHPPEVSQYIQQIARKNHATRIACGSTLEDEACAMVRAVIGGDVSLLLQPQECDPIPCMRPFMEIPEAEVILYARIHTGWTGGEGTPRSQRYGAIGEILEEFTSRHPSTPFALAHLKAAICPAIELSRPPSLPAR